MIHKQTSSRQFRQVYDSGSLNALQWLVVTTPCTGQIASATAEARFDALPPFFCKIYFHVHAGSAKKVGVLVLSSPPPNLTVFLVFFFTNARIEPNHENLANLREFSHKRTLNIFQFQSILKEGKITKIEPGREN